MRTLTHQAASVTFGAALLISLFSAGPAHAQTVETTATQDISAHVQAFGAEYGTATDSVHCYDNAVCEQSYEKAVITWSTRTGAHAIVGPHRVDAFKLAGGVEKLGALESEFWHSAYCGESVTTTDGVRRFMVVVDSGTQAGSYLSLNEAEAEEWRATRAESKACFADNVASHDSSVGI